MDEDTLGVIGLGIAILFTGVYVIFGSIMEAKSFNKFSEGKKATYIDAMFIELRVEACK